MKNILVVSGHPDLNNSIGNATILNEVAAALPEVEIRRLDTLYPDGNINVSAEQEALLKAEIIVWQFPFSWYSLPGIMKRWLDEVFVHGFAHGSTARLGGKTLILSFTAGAPQKLYAEDGVFGHKLEDYLIQFETTARLCNLEMQKPIYTCGISYAGRNEKIIAQQTALAKEHASRLIAQLNAELTTS
ncbi:NAD(P)H-dependent oxidoreductase [Pantoea agglomerans]|uniref:NAD(P)H-dependent oxidoreductase n=1 Tax=Enterobacter agglomerans TaxID=549 RepID=UPI003DA16D86